MASGSVSMASANDSDRLDDDSFAQPAVTLASCRRWLRQRYFGENKLRRRLPIVAWLPRYNLNCLATDAVAGLSVGFTLVPQG